MFRGRMPLPRMPVSSRSRLEAAPTSLPVPPGDQSRNEKKEERCSAAGALLLDVAWQIARINGIWIARIARIARSARIARVARIVWVVRLVLIVLIARHETR